MRLGPRVKVGVLLHAAVNLAFAARALGATAPPVPLGAVRPVVQGGPAVIALRPSTAPSGPPIAVHLPTTTAPPPPTTSRTTTTRPAAPAAVLRAVALVPDPTTTTTARRPIDLSTARFDRLAACESDGDPAAVNGPYRGAFQFLLQSWHDAGGEGDPVDASYAEQRAIAISWAHVVDPASQWPVCWPLTA